MSGGTCKKMKEGKNEMAGVGKGAKKENDENDKETQTKKEEGN